MCEVFLPILGWDFLELLSLWASITHSKPQNNSLATINSNFGLFFASFCAGFLFFSMVWFACETQRDKKMFPQETRQTQQKHSKKHRICANASINEVWNWILSCIKLGGWGWGWSLAWSIVLFVWVYCVKLRRKQVHLNSYKHSVPLCRPFVAFGYNIINLCCCFLMQMHTRLCRGGSR